MAWRFDGDRILLEKVPARPKKITGTRFASILGANEWQSEFEAWCDMTRVYSKPFVDNKYTLAGKAIEPILIEWAKEYFGEGVVSPKEYYGNTWDEVKKRYDFYRGTKIFGGMWDAKIVNGGKEYGVIEFKTSSRPQDWVDGAPLDKKLQSLLYPYLDKIERAFLVVAFLDEEHYSHPETFVPVEGENVKVYSYDVANEITMLNGEPHTTAQLVGVATEWWNEYLTSFLSPTFDEKRDAEVLKELRTLRPDEDEDKTLKDILKNIDELEIRIENIREEGNLDELEKELKNHKDGLKRVLTEAFTDDDEKVEVGRWSLSKSVRESIDTALLKADGLFDKYKKESVTYTLRSKKRT